MSCVEIREQLGGYLDGELPPSAHAMLVEHLRLCPACSAELGALRRLCASLAPRCSTSVPDRLWRTIETRLDTASSRESKRIIPFRTRRLVRFAACLLIALALTYFISQFGFDFSTPADAAPIEFHLLLDDVATDARFAFDRFLKRYHAEPTDESAAKTNAPKLSFEIPETLPCGFHREAVYRLNFGGNPAAAATYSREGEFLGVLFHPPVLIDDFGTHRDYACVVGEHRGHSTQVGEWSLVHFTDATTCHCVLSRLHPSTELPAVLAAVAPQLQSGSIESSHGHGGDQR